MRVCKRSKSDPLWEDITDKTKIKGSSYTASLGNEPLRANLQITDLDALLEINDNDLIGFFEDSNYTEVVDSVFLGQVNSPGKEIKSSHSTQVYTPSYSVQLSEYDFSSSELFSVTYEDTSLSTILLDVLSNYSNELLGGIIGITVINKFALYCEDLTISSCKFDKVGCREFIQRFLEENSLYWSLKWYSTPDTTNLLKVFCQIEVFDRTGKTPISSLWSREGITDTNLKQGRIYNPQYDFDTTKEQYHITERKFKYDFDKDIIKNVIDITANVVDSMAFSNGDSGLTRYTSKALPNQDTYKLPDIISGVKYAGFLVSGYVNTTISSPTATNFSIPSYVAQSVSEGDFIRVFNGTTENFRELSTLSGNEITLDEALTFTPTTDGTTLFEVIQQNWITIYDENESNYASRGIAVTKDLDREGQIRWLSRSAPPPGVVFIIHYYKATPRKQYNMHADSIEKYGIRKLVDKIQGIYTIEQYNQLIKSLEIPDPNYLCTFETFRTLAIGDAVPINVTGFTTDTLKVTSITCNILGGIYNGRTHRLYDTQCSTLKQSAEDILKNIEAKTLKNQVTGPDNPTIRKKETVNIQENINVLFGESLTPPTIDITDITDVGFTVELS